MVEQQRIRVVSLMVMAVLVAGCAPVQRPELLPVGLEAQILRCEDRREIADGFLVGLLNDSDAAVRRRAVLALGRIGDPTTIEALAVRLEDSVAAVRAAAAFALGELGDPAVRPALVGAVDDPAAEVRFFVFEALTKVGDAEASAAALAALTGETDDKVFADALRYTFRFQQSSWLDLYFKAVQRDPAAQQSVVYALSRLDLERLEAEQALTEEQRGAWLQAAITASSEADEFTASVAARGLGRFPELANQERDEALRKALKRPELSVRIQALRSWAEVAAGTETTWDEVGLLLHDEHPNVRVAALTALGPVGGQQAEQILVQRLTNGSSVEGAVSLAALFQCAPEVVRDGIDGLLDQDWLMRQTLAEGLAEVDFGEQALRQLWSDADLRVRYTALASLAARDFDDVQLILRQALTDSDPVVRTVAAGSIAGRDDVVEFSDALVMSFGGFPDEVFNDARLSLLAAFAAAGMNQELEGALEDRDWLVRRRAAELLEESDDIPRHVAPLPERPLDFYRAALDGSLPQAVEVTTERGAIEIELFWHEAPLTCANFLDLVDKGYYDGLAYHRVVPDFVVQDGCPRSDGWGGPGYQIRCEINLKRYTMGAVGMALAGKDTGGSQYFITLTPTPHLDGGYTVFGRVSQGMHVVRSLRRGDRSLRLTPVRDTDRG